MDIVLEFFRMNPDQWFTSSEISEKFNLISGNNGSFSKGILLKLKDERKLEESEKGFRLFKQGRPLE